MDDFEEKYINTELMKTQSDELTNSEAVKKFEKFAHLYPHLIISERGRVRKMMKMFCSDLTMVISSRPYLPVTAIDYVSRAIQAEY